MKGWQAGLLRGNPVTFHGGFRSAQVSRAVQVTTFKTQERSLSRKGSADQVR